MSSMDDLVKGFESFKKSVSEVEQEYEALAEVIVDFEKMLEKAQKPPEKKENEKKVPSVCSSPQPSSSYFGSLTASGSRASTPTAEPSSTIVSSPPTTSTPRNLSTTTESATFHHPVQASDQVNLEDLTLQSAADVASTVSATVSSHSEGNLQHSMEIQCRNLSGLSGQQNMEQAHLHGMMLSISTPMLCQTQAGNHFSCQPPSISTAVHHHFTAGSVTTTTAGSGQQAHLHGMMLLISTPMLCQTQSGNHFSCQPPSITTAVYPHITAGSVTTATAGSGQFGEQSESITASAAVSKSICTDCHKLRSHELWLKEELTREEIGVIADQLFKYDHLGFKKLKQIADKKCSRQKAAELLLKYVYKDNTVMHAFMGILKKEEQLLYIIKRIEGTQISNEDKKKRNQNINLKRKMRDSRCKQTSMGTMAKRKCVEEQVVNALMTSEGGKRFNEMTVEHLGLEFEKAKIGSIEIFFKLCPGSSLDKLESSCTTGKIKEIVSYVFEKSGIEKQYGERDYFWSMQILLQVPSSEREDVKERELSVEVIEDEDKLFKLDSRKESGKFQLESCLPLKEPSQSNEIPLDGCPELIENIPYKVQKKGSLGAVRQMELAALVEKTGRESLPDQKMIFSTTVVLSIKQKEGMTKDSDFGSDSDMVFEISCTDILEPKCYFSERACCEEYTTDLQNEVVIVLERVMEPLIDRDVAN